MTYFLRYILFSIALFRSLHGEIQQVEVTWLAGLCTTTCAQLMVQQFQKMPAISQINMNLPSAMVFLNYKPNAPFSFIDVRNAMALVGVRYHDIHVRVRGTIQKQGNNFLIVSIGDNTPFVLVGPLSAQLSQYVTTYNIASHPLTPYLIDQLQQAMTYNKTVVIEGPLFMPEWSPPSYLTISQLAFENPRQNP